MKIFHLSMECYPMAKVGGLADVVGSLPKYCQYGKNSASVVMPHYDLPWFQDKKFETIYEDTVTSNELYLDFRIQVIPDQDVGFPIYFIDIPELLFRDGVYSDSSGQFYTDEAERHIFFQRAFLQWIAQLPKKPHIVHCHDHHTALIPYMMKYCEEFSELASIPSILTIHNERYQGRFSWRKINLLPTSSSKNYGLLDWNDEINSLASGIKNAWKVTTVSPNYMNELIQDEGNLEWLFQNEKDKCVGILNGIDPQVWNPKKDEMLAYTLKRSVPRYKIKNKEILCTRFGLNKKKPIVAYIGRLAYEKGADLIPQAMGLILQQHPSIQVLMLGTGNPDIEKGFFGLVDKFPDRVYYENAYDEKLSHQIYAGTDFLLMPSRVEPCGLNQMYSLAYGSMPVVTHVGGLADTVFPYNGKKGNGIVMEDLKYESWQKAFRNALKIYSNPEDFVKILENNMSIDHSWSKTAKTYIKMYKDV